MLPTTLGTNQEDPFGFTEILVGFRSRKMGIAWIAWTELTKPKNQGGLGIREIQSFNEALLAKQSWRILSQPNGILARMLLSKYCRNKDFLDIDPKPNSSYGWIGILVGRDLLKQNLGKVIGNGKSTSIWRDPWTTVLKTGITTGPGVQAHGRMECFRPTHG